MRITLVPSDFSGPGCYRLLFPGRQLRAKGHNVFLPPHRKIKQEDGRELIEFHGIGGPGTPMNVSPPYPDADIWVLQQRHERNWAEDGADALRAQGVMVVSELDDNYVELPAYNPAFRGGHPFIRDDGLILNRAARRTMGKKVEPNAVNRVHLFETLRKSDAITVATPYLKEIYSRFNPNITVLRNYTDWDLWSDEVPQYELERKRVRVGWQGFHSFRRGDHDILKPWLHDWLVANPEVDFVTTSEETHDYLGVPTGQRVTTGVVEFSSMEIAKTFQMDVALIPLAPGGFSEGKSHLKGLEANSAGIPFIASPSESYTDYWCDANNGMIANTQRGWISNLDLLVNDRELIAQMGAHGRAKAQESSIQNNAWRWEEFYQGLLGDECDEYARIALRKGAIQKKRELAALARKVRKLRPKVVVEIGVARGGTFWLWTRLAHPDALIVGIDLPGGDFGGSKDTYGKRDYEKILGYGKPTQTTRIIEGNSQSDEVHGALLELLGGRRIDFLMIDGDHAYKGVKRDWELYGPLADMVAFHDVQPGSTKSKSEADRLWREINRGETIIDKNDVSERRYGKWAGIGVIEERVAA